MNYEPIYREAGHFQQSLKLDDIVKVCSIAFAGKNNIQEIKEMGSGFFNNTYCITFQDCFKAMRRVAPYYPELLYSHEKPLGNAKTMQEKRFASLSIRESCLQTQFWNPFALSMTRLTMS